MVLVHVIPLGAGRAEVSEAASTGLRVLLAEDSMVNQRLATGLLERKGHSVTVASTGRQAVELAQNQTFDLILMDVQMPDMDGLQASQAIRQWESTGGGHIPIIAMTGNDVDGDRERCLQAGMDDYLPKPIRSQELFDKMDRLLATGHPSAGPQASTASAALVQPGVAIDWDAALSAVGGKRALMRELIDLYAEEGPRLLEQARVALANNDADGLRIAAHTLKGSSRYFGPNAVETAAAQLEQLAGQKNLDEANVQFQTVASALANFLPALQRFDQHPDR